jgi:hypothetical protein
METAIAGVAGVARVAAANLELTVIGDEPESAVDVPNVAGDADAASGKGAPGPPPAPAPG